MPSGNLGEGNSLTPRGPDLAWHGSQGSRGRWSGAHRFPDGRRQRPLAQRNLRSPLTFGAHRVPDMRPFTLTSDEPVGSPLPFGIHHIPNPTAWSCLTMR